jgi:exosortase/archaeosortase family protein
VIELLPLGSTTTKKLEVVEACSGIRSLMTLVTLAVVFAYFTRPSGGGNSSDRRRRWFGIVRFAVIVLAAVPIAILTNAGRVSGTGVLSHYYGTQVADGFFHSFSGWVVYVVAFLMLFGFGWLVDRFEPARKGGGPDGGGGAAETVAATDPQATGTARTGEKGPVVATAPTAAMTGGSSSGGTV